LSPQVDLNRWSTHLAAAKQQNKSIASYAAQHGLSRHTLYAAARALRDAGKQDAKPSLPAFTPVRLNVSPAPPTSPPLARLTAHLPNGIILNIESLDTCAQMATLLNTLAALPCSR